jgi:hypothetical protein
VPKMIVYEIFVVQAKTVEEAKSIAEADSTRSKSVVVAAESLNALTHPIHLEEVQKMVGGK